MYSLAAVNRLTTSCHPIAWSECHHLSTKHSNDNNSELAFTTPAASGGAVDETVAATAYAVNCK